MSYETVMASCENALVGAGRVGEEVTVVAVSKGRSITEIMDLYGRGVRDFGENRAQELTEKVQRCPSDIRWHFIGPLQTNKVRLVRPVATLLHSMDRLDLAKAWMKGPGTPPPVLIQVNIGREPQKHGFDPDDLHQAVKAMKALGVPVTGLMAIPPQDRVAARSAFGEMRRLFVEVRDDHPEFGILSMGMSEDFESAIFEGATMIRVGRAIFGD